MMKTTFYILAFFVLALCGACESYLDVKPEDKYREDQAYSSEDGINMVFNGIYLRLSTANLYGASLTSTHIEILAQRYNWGRAADGTLYRQLGTYGFEQPLAQAAINAIWSESYSVILSLNIFMQKIAESDLLTTDKKNLLLGEALGLRAFLHFDLLRLFGPVYAVDSTALSIPYNTATVIENKPLLPANEIMGMIVQDLSQAEQLLQNDPVITIGSNDKSSDNVNFYNSFRNRRMNYYALKALQARVFLYRGDKVSAAAAANTVINNAGFKFPWISLAQVNNQSNANRVFSTEIIFGVQNPDMYNVQRTNFSSDLLDSQILTALQSTSATDQNTLSAYFENNIDDVRYSRTWIQPVDKSYRTFFKYADIQSKDSLYRMYQPLIRKSELYYIAAECEPDATRANELLQEVRKNRGIGTIPMTGTFDEELEKEYIKEFYGEGQLFYFYKRRNVPAIYSGSIANQKVAPRYVAPLPESETSVM